MANIQKVNRHIIYEDFLQAVHAIEQEDLPQKEKTRRFRGAANKVRTALFYDKRKFGDARRLRMTQHASHKLLKRFALYETELQALITATTIADLDQALQNLIDAALQQQDETAQTAFHELQILSEPRLAISTYRRYVTELRNKMRDLNLRHHSLPKLVQRYHKQFPAYKALLDQLFAADAHLAGYKRMQLLEAARQQDDPLAYAAFTKLKTDHEATRYLFVGQMEKITLEQEQAESLAYRKTHTIKIKPDGIFTLLHSLLHEPSYSPSYSYSRLAIAVALATGRRAVEVLYTGQFTKLDTHLLAFTGQAKKRAGTDQNITLRIPVLAEADLILKAVHSIRHTPELAKLRERTQSANTERDARLEVNKVASVTLNATIKRLLGEAFTFKDTRAIYARMVYTHYFRTPPWEHIDEDEFFRLILGHQDYETIKSYKCIQLDANGVDFSPATQQIAIVPELIEALRDFDISPAGRGAIGIHRFVKFILAVAPGTPITQTLLNRRAGEVLERLQTQQIDIPEPLRSLKTFGRPAVQKYLNFAKTVIDPYNAACLSAD
jgi:hypothetical protein